MSSEEKRGAPSLSEEDFQRIQASHGYDLSKSMAIKKVSRFRIPSSSSRTRTTPLRNNAGSRRAVILQIPSIAAIRAKVLICSPGRGDGSVLRAGAGAGQGAEDHRQVEEGDGGAAAHAGQRLAQEEAPLAGGGVPRAEPDAAHRALERELYCISELHIQLGVVL